MESDWFCQSQLSAHIPCCRIWKLAAPSFAKNMSGKLNLKVFKKSELNELNKTFLPFVLVRYDFVYSQLGTTRLVGHLPSSHIQSAFHQLITNSYLYLPRTGLG